MAIEPTKAIKIFYSYAHEDKKFRDKLDRHLETMKRSGLIVTWYDRDIQAGTQWEDEIDTRLNTADLILLLISDDFFGSDYCYGREMQRALERHDAKEARVIPIILSPVLLEDAPVSKLKALPSDGRAITEWRNRDSAFMKVAQEIRDVVKTLHKQQEAIYQKVQGQSSQTIDTHEAVALFHRLLQASNERQIRIMYLLGDANMGKSHLLKKVFPVVAQYEYQARCVFFDLRNPIHSVSDILNMAYEQLGAKNCNNYYNAMQEISGDVKTRGDIISTLTQFASLNTFTGTLNNTRGKDERLTTQLVLDLDKLHNKPLVLFFDTVDNANQDIQSWLVRTFLAKLSLLSHVRIVIAGRVLPEAPGDYVDLLQLYQLHAVKDEEEYITYCQSLHPTLLAEKIRTLARECNYTPGLFANYLFTEIGAQGT